MKYIINLIKVKIYIPFAGLRINYYRLKPLLKSYLPYNNKDRLISEIIQDYHVIEKGLTMPEMRLGFGYKVIIRLCEEVIEYTAKFDSFNKQVLNAIGVIIEYDICHKSKGFIFDKRINDSIERVYRLKLNVNATKQINLTKAELYRDLNSDFFHFSYSRHTIRHFKEDVSIPLDNIIKALALAQNSPSACNRQSVRVKLVTDKILMKELFKIQSGNRGFGNLIDKLIVVTFDMGYWNYITTIGGYVDSGIYMMNLLYSLHYYKIGACSLNTLFNKSQDKKVRQLINLPSTEIIAGFIGIGEVADNLVIAKSTRNDLNDVLTIIK